MKTVWQLTTLFALCPFVFVSCETVYDRVNEMPLPGYGGSYATPETSSYSQSGYGSDLLNQIQDSSTLGAPSNNSVPSTPSINPGSGTLANELNQAGISVAPKTSTATRSTGISDLTRTESYNSNSGISSLKSSNSVQSASTTSAAIPTAFPTADPNVVRSPYDSTKLIRIQRPDGTRWESGKVLLDTNFPKSENKKFRVP